MDIQHILNELKDENEIAIVEKYNCVAKRYMIAITGKTIFIFACNHIFI